MKIETLNKINEVIKDEIYNINNIVSTQWEKAKLLYAEDFIEDLINNFEYNFDYNKNFNKDYEKEITEELLLNGAKDWREYSYGGNSLIYNIDIMNRLINPETFLDDIQTINSKYNKLLYKNRDITILDLQALCLEEAAKKY